MTRGRLLIVLAGVVALGLGILLWRVTARDGSNGAAEGSACVERLFEGERFTVCSFDPGKHRLRMMLDGPDGVPIRGFERLKTVLGKDAGKLRFAMNGGMFDKDGRPLGLYVQDGNFMSSLNRRDAAGNFYMKPNGVFWLDERGAHVAPTDDYARVRQVGVRQATQSGPMLVIGGKLHPEIARDGESLNLRNGMGVDGKGRVFFAISAGEVSFGQFARFFRDSLGCPDALYLDGFVSALWNPVAGRPAKTQPLGPMIVVSDTD